MVSTRSHTTAHPSIGTGLVRQWDAGPTIGVAGHEGIIIGEVVVAVMFHTMLKSLQEHNPIFAHTIIVWELTAVRIAVSAIA